jgi:hypothetical protein
MTKGVRRTYSPEYIDHLLIAVHATKGAIVSLVVCCIHWPTSPGDLLLHYFSHLIEQLGRLFHGPPIDLFFKSVKYNSKLE